MPTISVALLVFAAAFSLSVNLWRSASEVSALRWLAGLALLAAMQALMLSLRWDYGFTQVRPLQALLAAALPPLSWLAFRPLWTSQPVNWFSAAMHVAPAILCLLALLKFPDAIDGVIIVSFLAYGAAFLRLCLADESRFNLAALDGVFNLRRALMLMTAMLFGSAFVDIAVLAAFIFGRGERATLLIGLGNVAWLLLLGAGILLGRNAIVPQDGDIDVPDIDVVADQQVVQQVHALLTDGKLSREPGLTLSRLARRAGLPVRSVSQAINRVQGRNVSQYVNDIRIAEACRLLENPDLSITQVIYESGFQTKSNFNREFLRVTGKSPREWRNENGRSGQLRPS
jgi:AraC-like DNA-binding protein